MGFAGSLRESQGGNIRPELPDLGSPQAQSSDWIRVSGDDQGPPEVGAFDI